MAGWIVEWTITSAPLASLSTCSDADDDRGGRGTSLPASAHFDIALRPHNLRLVFCLKCDRVDQVRRAACGAFFDLGMALGDFAGLNERIRDVRGEFLTADGETQSRNGVRSANRVDLGAGAEKHPAQRYEIGKPFGVVIVHVREEDRIQLLGRYV